MEIEENESRSQGLYKQIHLLDTPEEKGCGRNLWGNIWFAFPNPNITFPIIFLVQIQLEMVAVMPISVYLVSIPGERRH